MTRRQGDRRRKQQAGQRGPSLLLANLRTLPASHLASKVAWSHFSLVGEICPQAPMNDFCKIGCAPAELSSPAARHKAEDDYLLTTKLFCGYCGAYLCGESGTSRTGKVHHYYKCVSVKKKRTECHKKPVRKEWIEDLVVVETMKMVMDDKAIEAIVSMLMDVQDRDNVNVPLYEQQLREA